MWYCSIDLVDCGGCGGCSNCGNSINRVKIHISYKKKEEKGIEAGQNSRRL